MQSCQNQCESPETHELPSDDREYIVLLCSGLTDVEEHEELENIMKKEEEREGGRKGGGGFWALCIYDSIGDQACEEVPDPDAGGGARQGRWKVGPWPSGTGGKVGRTMGNRNGGAAARVRVKNAAAERKDNFTHSLSIAGDASN